MTGGLLAGERNLRSEGPAGSETRSEPEVVSDPHLQARGLWHTVQATAGPSLLTAGTPFVIDGHKPPLSASWPKLGEHTESVLREWLQQS